MLSNRLTLTTLLVLLTVTTAAHAEEKKNEPLQLVFRGFTSLTHDGKVLNRSSSVDIHGSKDFTKICHAALLALETHKFNSYKPIKKSSGGEVIMPTITWHRDLPKSTLENATASFDFHPDEFSGHAVNIYEMTIHPNTVEIRILNKPDILTVQKYIATVLKPALKKLLEKEVECKIPRATELQDNKSSTVFVDVHYD